MIGIMVEASKSPKRELDDPKDWVDLYGDRLYYYALRRLGNADSAKTVVQETFLAAFKGKDRFSGKSAPLTWLTGILKHKVVDQIRKESRERPLSQIIKDDQQSFDDFFDATGHWKDAPGSWALQPSEVAENKEFWLVLQECVSKLPGALGQAFMLKEVDQKDSEEVCKELEISKTNLWVMLHRARTRLRKCLEINWIGRTS